MRHEEKLDVLSRIDEEIVDRNTKPSRMRSSSLYTVLALTSSMAAI